MPTFGRIKCVALKKELPLSGLLNFECLRITHKKRFRSALSLFFDPQKMAKNLKTIGKKTFLVIFLLPLFILSKGQALPSEDSLQGFSMQEMNHHLESFKGTEQERNARIATSQRAFIDRKYKLGGYNIPALVRKINAQLTQSHNVQATNCNNIGFDDGTTTGWTISGAGPTNGSSFGTGAPTAGSSYITSGAGLDPFGNFPVVFSGAHSLQLSDNNTSTSNFLSTASRVIAVAPTGNTFFTLDFAIDILDYPHTQTDCARFTVAFYDASGTELACPQYECYYTDIFGNNGTAVGVSSFQQTAGSPGYNLGNQYYPVTYSPWQSVAMDLTSYAGTNVTCVVSCSWCLYNYDWAYCYIDAACPFSNATNIPSCGTLPFELQGPAGFTTYSWAAPAGNNPATSTTDSINASVTGTYSLTCTLNSCSSHSTYNYTFLVETSPLASFTDVAGSACSGNFTFTSTSTPNGGAGITGYTWEWGDGTPNSTGASTSHTFANGSIDTVTLVVTNGTCTDSVKKAIAVSAPIVPVVTATPAICYDSNGSITTAGTSGGTPAYMYLWSNTSIASSISAKPGTYSVTITDANNCTATATAIITQPTQLRDSITKTVNLLCFGGNNGSITVGVKGGTSAYTYSWAPVGQTTSAATNLTAGGYTVTVTDAKGCSGKSNGNITQPPALVVTANSFSVTCNGACNGQLVSIASGGTGPYGYLWSNNATSAGVTNVCPGTYSLQVTDANGCVTDTTGLIITQPTAITGSTTTTTAHCSQADGGACITANNGTPGYTYLWSNSTTTTCITNVLPGNYKVIITDANKCNDTVKVTVPNVPCDTAIITATTNVTCNGGNDGTATGGGKAGNPPFTYSWAPGGQTNQTATGLTAGNYTVTVTDAVGCTSTAVATITQPAIVVATPVTPPVICIGQSATLTVSATGGTPGYTYTWSTGSTGPSVSVSPIVTTTYTVNTVDANNCPALADTVIVTVHPPLTVAVSPNKAICPGNSTNLTATAKGGDGTYTYTWIPIAGLTPVTGPTVAASPATTTQYTVIVNDACGTPSVKDSVLVTVNPLPAVSFTADTLNGCTPLCIKFTNNTTIVGGGAFSYAWSYGDGDGYLGKDTTYCYKDAGVYTVGLIVTSDSNCIDSLIVPNMITAYSHPVAAFTYNPTDPNILDPTVNFVDETTDAYGIKNWFWQFGDPADGASTKQSPSYTYADTGTYCTMLFVKNIHNCTDSIEHCIIVAPYFTFYIPNAFTPTSFGLNAFFAPKGTYICNFEMYIFDRWGQQMFTTKDINQGWNGIVAGGNTMAQEDTYIYLIEVTDCVEHKKHQYMGRVTLIK